MVIEATKEVGAQLEVLYGSSYKLSEEDFIGLLETITDYFLSQLENQASIFASISFEKIKAAMKKIIRNAQECSQRNQYNFSQSLELIFRGATKESLPLGFPPGITPWIKMFYLGDNNRLFPLFRGISPTMVNHYADFTCQLACEWINSSYSW